MEEVLYTDRFAAGRVLAECIANELPPDPLFLAVPRGGVPVAHEMASRFGAPLDLLFVRRISVPEHEELALGAIALAGEHPVRVDNDQIVERTRIHPEFVERAAERERRELQRQQRTYRGDAPPPLVRGRHVMVVDDGLATGVTMRVAVKALRRLGVASITVTVPVAPRDTVDLLALQGAHVVCPAAPEPFMAVGFWYDDFEQLVDAQVQRLLAVHRFEHLASHDLREEA